MTSYKVKYRLVIWLRNSRCLSKINVYVFSQRLWKGMFFVVSGPNRWMEPQTIVHSCNGTLRSKPEWIAHRIWAIKAVLSKGSQIQKRMQCGLHLHRNSRSGPMSLECGKKQISICPRSAVGLGLSLSVREGFGKTEVFLTLVLVVVTQACVCVKNSSSCALVGTFYCI